MKKLPAFVSLIVLGCVVFALTAAAKPAATPLTVHQAWFVRHLLVPGDRVEIGYDVSTPGSASVTGSLYVRNDLKRGFERLPLQVKRGSMLRTVVPAHLIRGHELLYYAVVRDRLSGLSARVPAAGARAPQVAWVLEQPAVVRLGSHRFGHPRPPEAIVARGGANQVGWLNEPGDHAGPETFLVGPDRSIWLHDEINHRLLVWRAGHPGTVARSLVLPFADALNVALGPAGTLYATRGLPNPPRLELYRLSASGQVRWHSPLAGAGGEGCGPLYVVPGGTLYCGGYDQAWWPVATPAGRPLSPAEQRRRTQRGLPVADGLRLLSQNVYREPNGVGPAREIRFALIDRSGQLVHAWRVTSGTALEVSAACTPTLVGGDPVVVLGATSGGYPNLKSDYIVLRLSPGGTHARFSLRRSVYGDNPSADLRFGPDGKLYQLGSSPTTGVIISRYSLGPGQSAGV